MHGADARTGVHRRSLRFFRRRGKANPPRHARGRAGGETEDGVSENDGLRHAVSRREGQPAFCCSQA
ncbi:MerR family transcriptional regulator [Microbacterium proteolyticum]|uniref:MerR family transcriptional regulator n=1 Tax=Microbacterium TaxID=33882 RepID=UPI0035A9AD6A